MLSRSICIVLLILLIWQIIPVGTPHVLRPLHPAWLLQDRLPAQIEDATQQPWPFSRRARRRRRRKRRTRRQEPRRSSEEPIECLLDEGEEPPEDWPDELLSLVDQEACRHLIQQVRWEQGLVCPHCGSSQVKVLRRQITSGGWQRYACQACYTPGGYHKTFSDLTGTPWEGSHLNPAQLLVSLAAFVEGHSAEEIARQVGAQPRIGQRLRRLYQVVLYKARPELPLDGEIEADEVYIIAGYKGTAGGQKPPRPPRERRLKGQRGRGTWENDKVPLVAIVQRQGQVRLFAQRNLQQDTFRPLLQRWIRQGAQIYTDCYDIYDFLSAVGHRHRTIKHSEGVYAHDQVHINTAEGLFSLLRPYLATFRGVSKVYLPLYIRAFEFRYNHRYLTNWEQTGLLLRRLYQVDGPSVRRAVRNTTVVELCGLPT